MKNCRCGGALVMRRKRSFDRENVIWACSSCHRGFGAVSQRDVRALSYEELRDLPRAVVVRRKQPNSKRRAYQAALKSKHWRDLRERVFARAGGVCEVDGCKAKAAHLGHLHYRTLSKETEDDVRAECVAHSKEEREQRITRAVLGS